MSLTQADGSTTELPRKGNDMATKKQEMNLEEFEAQRHEGNRLGTGKWQAWLRELSPLTPTAATIAKSPRAAQTALMSAWHGRGVNQRTSVQKEKGGVVRSTIIGGNCWVVWYPEDQNGS